MTAESIGWFVSPFGEKFGTPRQSGVVPDAPGEIHFHPDFRRSEALRGLDGFDYLWIIWEFSLNRTEGKMTVRPPRLGGNERLGVFATRSPFRPNPIGLSSVRIESVDFDKCVIHVSGADIVDGTPILDIKPYIAYTDSHPDARGGFTEQQQWQTLRIVNPEAARELVGEELVTPLLQALVNDPRPHYQRDNTRVYGLKYADREIHFKVDGDALTIL